MYAPCAAVCGAYTSGVPCSDILHAYIPTCLRAVSVCSWSRFPFFFPSTKTPHLLVILIAFNGSIAPLSSDRQAPSRIGRFCRGRTGGFLSPSFYHFRGMPAWRAGPRNRHPRFRASASVDSPGVVFFFSSVFLRGQVGVVELSKTTVN